MIVVGKGRCGASIMGNEFLKEYCVMNVGSTPKPNFKKYQTCSGFSKSE